MMDRTVTTYRLPLQTMGTLIQWYLDNSGTMPKLLNTTLAPRVPQSYGSTWQKTRGTNDEHWTDVVALDLLIYT
jgi:hypothetical protein